MLPKKSEIAAWDRPPCSQWLPSVCFLMALGVEWYIIWKVSCATFTSVVCFKIGSYVIDNFDVERFENLIFAFVSLINKNFDYYKERLREIYQREIRSVWKKSPVTQVFSHGGPASQQAKLPLKYFTKLHPFCGF